MTWPSKVFWEYFLIHFFRLLSHAYILYELSNGFFMVDKVELPAEAMMKCIENIINIITSGVYSESE